jgi:hypothetical protein
LKALCLHLERARDREGGLETAWCADYWRGSAWGVWWWRELKEANEPPAGRNTQKNGAENGQFPTLFGQKIDENAVFHLKNLSIASNFVLLIIYKKNLNKKYSQDVF